MFWFIIGLAINIMFTFAVYCRMRVRGIHSQQVLCLVLLRWEAEY